MVIVPKQKPWVQHLNSYYLDISKLIEHYQGELGAGCIHFRSPDSQGAIYFDTQEIFGGIFQMEDQTFRGKKAVDVIARAAVKRNFSIDIYRIPGDEIHLWGSIPDAKVLYRDLSTAFTDLAALIQKLKSEKLTGFIEIAFDREQENAIFFFIDGAVAGGSCSSETDAAGDPERMIDRMVAKTRDAEGVFHVSQIFPQTESAPEPADRPDAVPMPRVIRMLEQMMHIFEDIIVARKKQTGVFSTLLKRKFIQKADTYAFLDPFAGEFTYVNGKISCSGTASAGDLARGLVETVRELSNEIGVTDEMTRALAPWFQKFETELAGFDIRF